MKALVLGAGAVGTVAALKFSAEAMVQQLIIADAVPARAAHLADRLGDPRVRAITLDAGNRREVARAIAETGSTILLNAALPATNLEVMHACLEAGCHYIDMASGGTDDDGVPKMEDQFALDAAFRARGLLALLGMGADPGTTNVYAAYAARHLLDQVSELRVRDGDNAICLGREGFVAAFSPWVFIDECLCRAVSWREGRYHLEEPLSGKEAFDFPELGTLNTYYVDHEEAKTLPRFFPQARVVDFKLVMDEVTYQTLRVFQQVGLSRKDRIRVNGTEVSPRDVVVSLLPRPGDLAGKLRGQTCVGTVARGLREGRARSFYLYSVADHDAVYRQHGVQATAWQTGVPPVIAATLITEGAWAGTGVMSPEQFDPVPFLERLGPAGMPWQVRDDTPKPAERPLPAVKPTAGIQIAAA